MHLCVSCRSSYLHRSICVINDGFICAIEGVSIPKKRTVEMDGAADFDYSREAYTRHQKEKQLESTKVWVLSLPQHRLDLRCHSTASVKVDEFFHSTLYFQWCVTRLKKRLAGSLSEDQDSADWARMIFEYMMAASERKPLETYSLTDQQVLTDAKEVFWVNY